MLTRHNQKQMFSGRPHRDGMCRWFCAVIQCEDGSTGHAVSGTLRGSGETAGWLGEDCQYWDGQVSVIGSVTQWHLSSVMCYTLKER